MSNVNMMFGSVVPQSDTAPGMILVDSGYLGGENTDTVTLGLLQYQMYVLFTREIVISSGALRGDRAILIARSEADTFTRGNMYASTNAGVTITNNTDSITLKPNTTTYDVYYALYAVM